jgi:DNA helicase II / ATP-dependent DNA helicase PcrA
MNSSSYLDTLNKEQREAVLHTQGPLLILAGAGAGKTKTLTHRIFHLIKEGVHPDRILAITFTNKAAAELRDRIRALIERELGDTHARPPLAKTFHSLAVLILREQHQLLDLPRFFSIFDRADSLSAIKEAQKHVPGGSEIKPASALALISSKKSDSVTLEDFEMEAEAQYRLGVYAGIWREYERILKREKALDFDDLLVKAVELLYANPNIARFYKERWTHLHIDEYQDTNRIQYEFSKLLVGPEQNVCVVGDADQTIYTWRGANIQNILDFEKDFQGAKTVLLEQNYRSTKTILRAANDCIKKNTMRKEKNLYTENDDGENVALCTYVTEEDEGEGIVSRIESLIEEGVPPHEIGVLYRANFQSRVLEESMVRRGIPYRLIGVKFFDRKEVKDVISYIRAAFNRDSRTDMKRAAGFPKRGLGPTTIERICEGDIASLGAGARDKARTFVSLLDRIKEKAEKERPSDVIRFILKESGIEDALEEGGDEGRERLENARELASLAASFDDTPGIEGIERLIESASLTADADDLGESVQGVSLMTVHAAKGLEFDYVFITGLEEGLFPQRKERSTRAEEEEERRLFYVALTRARKKLYLSYALSRRVFGSRIYSHASEFVTEMDPELVEETQIVREGVRTGYLDDIEF